MFRPYSRFAFGCGLVLLALSAFWHFVLSPRWFRRIQPGWSWQSTFAGTAALPDAVTGRLPASDPVVVFEKGIRPVRYAGSAPSVQVEDFYDTRDPLTNQKTWEYSFQAGVDPATGAHTHPEYRGDIYVFPRSVQKQIYRFRWNYVKGLPLKFEQEEEIEGIPTYVFEYRGRAEYTESYAGTKDYPGVKVAPGQQIRCRDDLFLIRLWVEPVTGEMLKMSESCSSGDYIHDSAGKPITAVMRWSAVTAGDDVVLRAGIIRNSKSQLLVMVHYVPRSLALAGLLTLLGALLMRWRESLRRV